MNEVEIYENIHDKAWRMANLYKITDKEKKTRLFRPNRVQERLIESPERFEAVLKARQLGISTYYLISKLDDAIWNENKTVVILAHEQDAIKKLFRIVQFAHKNMPDALRPTLGRGGGSMYELYFPAVNSRIYCDLESRGDTISDLHISEYAFVKNPDKVKATMDAVPIQTGSISIETTPNGMNHFYDEYRDDNWPFKRYFFPWYFDPQYALPVDETFRSSNEEEKKLVKYAKSHYGIELTQEQIAFRRFKIAQKGKAHFMQEFPEDEESCFLASGANAMDIQLIGDLRKLAPAPIYEDEREGLKIWEDADPWASYVVGADTAEGVAKDYSVATVYKLKTREQVAQIRGRKWKPGVFAQKIYDLCERYKNNKSYWPFLGVERNNHGHAVLLKLEETLLYPNLYSHDDGRPGWKTNSATRPILIDQFIEAVEDMTLKVRDADTFNECLTLIDNGGKIEAMDGKHDDCIIASAIAYQVSLSNSANFIDNMLKM